MSEVPYSDLPINVRDYLFHIGTIKGRSKKTVEAYAIDLRFFFKFIKCCKNNISFEKLKNVDITDVDVNFISSIRLSDVYEFLHFTLNEHNNNARTRSRKVSSIKGFFKYMTINVALLKENPVEHLEVPTVKKSLPKYLTLEQSLSVLKNVETKYPLRDYCIFALFLNCGMRISELVGINISDMNLKNKTLRLLGKGNKERNIYMNDSCVKAVEEYMTKERSQLKKITDKDALFLSATRGGRISVRQVQNIVRAVIEKNEMGNMGISPHKLRHTAATLMYNHGNVDIRVLKEILGHSGIGTTEIYTHISDKRVEEAIQKNPLAKINVKNKT